MPRRIIGQIALLAVTGCAAQHVERAAVSPAPVEGAAVAAPSVPALFDYDVDPSQSRFEVWGTDLLSGDHRIVFGTWSASIRANAITAEIATCTAQIDLPSATGLLRSKLLECEKYPRATLEGTFAPTDRKDVYVVDGVSELHGVRKELRFTGRLTPDGERYRFKAAFVIDRQDFGIHYGPIEPFLRDDVRIVIDVVAVPRAR